MRARPYTNDTASFDPSSAKLLGFTHPSTGRRLRFTAPVSSAFSALFR